MTPAIVLAQKACVEHTVHRYDHDPSAGSYGLEAAEKLGVNPDRIFKTLVVARDDGALAVGVLSVNKTLNLKKMAKALGAKKVSMADTQRVRASTGYLIGGVSPLAQKKALPTVIDISAEALSSIYVSAGKRGLELELCADDLCSLTKGTLADIANS